MRFEPEALHGANAGLHVARELMEKVKQEFPWISYGDLWTLGGVAAIQVRSFLVYCYVLSLLFFSYRKWLAPRSPGAQVALTVSLPRLHLMDVSLMLLRARTTLEASFTAWGTCDDTIFNLSFINLFFPVSMTRKLSLSPVHMLSAAATLIVLASRVPGHSLLPL